MRQSLCELFVTLAVIFIWKRLPFKPYGKPQNIVHFMFVYLPKMVCKWHNHIIVIYLFIILFVYHWTANYLLVISKIGEYPTMCRFYECPKIHCVRKEKSGIFGSDSDIIGLFDILCSITKMYENDMNFMTGGRPDITCKFEFINRFNIVISFQNL